MADREIWITGIGLLSSLGEGLEAHRERLYDGDAPVTDTAMFPPYIIHPLAKVDLDRQIPKKGDQRQMEPWQRIGTYAAGLALTEAGIAGNTELLRRTDMIVAAGGGERDVAVDSAIMTDLRRTNRPDIMLNERLQRDLRPTLFLAQLSNLLAGNISIVHGVVGSSRTFMGEEGAGVSALQVAHARLAAGQSEITLVGSAYNAERMDLLVLHLFDHLCLKGKFAPIFAPGRAPGFALGSMGAFLVLESRTHAEQRGVKPVARLVGTRSGDARRGPAGLEGAIAAMIELVKGDGQNTAVISMATGAEPATGEEGRALEKCGLPVRALASRLGHGVETAFLAGAAVAAIAVREGKLFGSMPNVPIEQKSVTSLQRAIVTCVGHWRGEGVGVIEAVR
jgi:3-oxoacyl-[acyl-carrier-protein] synthase II